MRLGFLGAAGEVTGSCTLVEAAGLRFVVDCGMFQGGSEARGKNQRALHFGCDMRQINFVLLTHAHIDHSGLLPRLVMLGYRGPIYATLATIDLLRVLLPDSAHIQEKEAEWYLRNRYRRGMDPRAIPMPLYSVEQALAALRLLRPVRYGEVLHPAGDVSVHFHDAGHILGSAWLEVSVGNAGQKRRLIFSGDLGQPDRPVLLDPQQPDGEADALLVESTYGDRRHRSLAETEDEIVEVCARTWAAGGNLIIPSFAVGRTQEIIYLLTKLVRSRRLQPLKVYVDSPMASIATRITLTHPELLDTETHELIAWQQAHPELLELEFVADVERSKELNDIRSGAVIISASGMCEAGRIKYHLRENLPRRECSILIAGFQAAGTLGRRLVDGARLVRIFGQQVPVRARIATVGGLSAHADQAALLDWLGGFQRPPRYCFVGHGEARAAAALVAAIKVRYDWPEVRATVPGEFVSL